MYWELFKPVVSSGTLALASGKLAAVLRAGVLLPDAVSLIAEETADRRMKRVLAACAEQISDGKSFSEALATRGEISELFTETVRAGEENGRIAETFDYLSAYYGRRSRVKRKLCAALWYPGLLVVLAAVVVWIVMAWLVPVMTQIFAASELALPLPTRMLIAASRFLSLHGTAAAAALIGLAAGARVFVRTRRGGLLISRLALRLPVVGGIVRLNAAGQLAHTVAMLTSAGVALPKVMRVAGRVLGSRAVGERVALAAGPIESGDSLGAVWRENRYLPKILCEMASVGEKTGTLETTMSIAGAYCDAEAASRTERVLQTLEPAFTLLMGLLVAFIVISVFVPVLSMYNAVGLWM